MKKLFLLLLLPLFLDAKSSVVSSVPLPRTYILNTDPYPCNEECLQSYLDKGMIFSFLAHADSQLSDAKLEESRLIQMSLFNVGSTSTVISTKKVRIAIVLPYRKIGKYAASTTNASFAYLMTKSQSFELKSFKIENENEEEFQRVIEKIQKEDFDFIVAPVTQNGAEALAKINSNISIYIPTVNKKDARTTSSNIYYGGIDYRAQTDLLLAESASPLVIFYDNSIIGTRLAQYEEDTFKVAHAGRVVKYSVPARTTNLKNYLDRNSKISNGSFFINTPIVKTGMIMSQMTLYDVRYKNILSTQINYDPLLLSMTQINDRKKMIIANSIIGNTNILIDTNALLTNDIIYDWINFTTTVGIDYFFNRLTNEDRDYVLPMVENQIIYQIELLKPSVSRFVPISTEL